MRVLTWNLKHGRSVPSAGRDLYPEFLAALRRWEWDVALLQEVPPWWPAALAAALGAEAKLVLTSRNSLLALRRALAVRWPDAIKSNGGGANAILVRGLPLHEHRVARLGWRPERRWVHAVRAGSVWLANLHAQGTPAQADRAAELAGVWAGDAPVLLGGDFNLRSLSLERFGFHTAAAHEVDYVFTRGFTTARDAAVLDPGPLSDHAPVAVTVEP